MGTFVVRGYDARKAWEFDAERKKTIVENGTFHLYISEGSRGGRVLLNHFIDKKGQWKAFKSQPQAYESIKFPGQNEEIVSAKEMLTSALLSTQKYMESWQGFYLCCRKEKDEEGEVQLVFNVPSLCRSPKRLELRDYQSLLAMINIVRTLVRKEGLCTFNRNPLKVAYDYFERING